MSEPLDLLAMVARQDEIDGIARGDRRELTDEELARLWEAWDSADGQRSGDWTVSVDDRSGIARVLAGGETVTRTPSYTESSLSPEERKTVASALIYMALSKTAFVPLLRRLAVAEATIRDMAEDGKAVQVLRQLRQEADHMRAGLEEIARSYGPSTKAFAVATAALTRTGDKP
jgi:hypothetical protein